MSDVSQSESTGPLEERPGLRQATVWGPVYLPGGRPAPHAYGWGYSLVWPGDPWLTVEGYKAWARIDEADTTDDAAIGEAVDAAGEAIELRAPRGFTVTIEDDDEPVADPVPHAVRQAGLLLTNRLMARRNSPDGVVGVSDMGTATILSYDADINALLAPWSEMVLG